MEAEWRVAEEVTRDWKRWEVEEEVEESIIDLMEFVEEVWTVQCWQEKDSLVMILYERREEKGGRSHSVRKRAVESPCEWRDKEGKKL